MVSLLTVSKAQRMIADGVRARRLARNLSQAGLSERSGVPAPTLAKFERTGLVSLQSYLKLEMALGNLEAVTATAAFKPEAFSSIDEVLEATRAPARKRGRRK